MLIVSAVAAPVSGSVSATDRVAPARALVDLSRASFPSAMARAVAVAAEATKIQAATLGLAPTESRPLPVRGFRQLAERFDAVQTPLALDQLDALPSGLRGALDRVIDAFARLDAATTAAFDGADLSRLATGRETLRARSGAADPGRLLREAGLHLGPVLAARIELLRSAAEIGRMPARAGLEDISFPPVLSVDFDGSDDVYEDNFALLVDFGGNDVYRNNAGGSTVFGCCDEPTPAAAALLDFAGDDSYDNIDNPGVNGGGFLGSGFLLDATGSDTYVGTSGSNGGGTGGAGFLLDVEGDDLYQAGNASDPTTNVFADTAINGGGAVGAGMLLDLGGADRYVAGPVCTNGGGCEGSGMIFDASGDDAYWARDSGTNGGGTGGGSGMLVEGDGNDVYEAVGFGGLGSGTNGGASFFGEGLLYDAAGSDSYRGGSDGTNGGGVLLGSGLLHDESGNDLYVAGDLGTNGGASFFGEGLLYDAAGSDSYRGGSEGTNGGGFLGGSGLLHDESGNDLYVAGDLGTNGGGAAGGAGTLIDRAGDDQYRAGPAGTNGEGAAGCFDNFLQEVCIPAGSGLLLDLRGADLYTDDEGTFADRSVVPKGTIGAQIDASAPRRRPERR